MGDSAGWVLSAVALGFAYAALPGAVNAEALRRGVAGGFSCSFLVHVGGMIGAAIWAIVALTGTSLIERFEAITIALGFIGAVFLLRLAMIALIGARTAQPPPPVDPKSGADLTAGLVVGVANPAGLPFWTGLASDVVLQGSSDSLDPGRGAVFVAGVSIGSLLWGLTLSSLIAWGRRYLSPQFFRIVNGICAVAFGYFGFRLLWTSLTALCG
jgi:threonine/homoserine/homoserine lactone efflux protein